MESLSPDLLHELQRDLAGEVRTDLVTRLLYSTDASNYQIEPLAVAFPRTLDDLQAAVELAARYHTPVLARGTGSSLAGQAIGRALILDCTRYLTKIGEIDPEEGTVVVEPGVILTTLNKAVASHDLVFGPDPASAERATMGGSIANNATGAHSIQYGMASDHLIDADVVLADGSLARFAPLTLAEAHHRASPDDTVPSIASRFYRTALSIRTQHAGTIREDWPHIWRRASGYNLNYLLPWSATKPPRWFFQDQSGRNGGLPYPPVPADQINLAPLLAGSEGTLAVIRRMKLRLVPKPSHAILALLTFSSIAESCDPIQELLETEPSAVELIPGDLLRLARSVPAYAHQISFIQGNPEAMLVVEYSGENPAELKDRIRLLRSLHIPTLQSDMLVAESADLQRQIWNVRKVGLGLINSKPGDRKGIPFIEDIAVPAERLGTFVRGIERILDSYGTRAVFYAHTSAGCLHFRPELDLKTLQGVRELRLIAEEALDLTLEMGGVMSGEHGDGLARSELNAKIFGPRIMALFGEIKQAADPDGILNPGKIINPLPLDANLRYGTGYQSKPWIPALDFSSMEGLAGAIEMCNGAGVCRKDDGVMCPSFQVTQEEMHSTRGRSNLLRALISGKFPNAAIGEKTVYEALDLCLACKGCKSECPSAVDVAKLRYEFTNQFYKTHRRKLRDYLFGYIGLLAPLGKALSPLINPVMCSGWFRKAGERLLGLAHQRRFPSFASLRQGVPPDRVLSAPDVLFLTDAFSRYFHPETERAARRALETAGLRVQVLPVLGAGRTLISKGFLEPARHHASRLVATIRHIDPDSRLPVVGVEPSEIYTLSDEFPDLFPGDEYVTALAKRAWMVDEFLLRPDEDGRPRMLKLLESSNGKPHTGKVLLHGHCYQKARPPADDGLPTGVAATLEMLRLAGFQVDLIEAGCCGMAGAFGYESEHYELSIQVGELSLFPSVRQADPATIVAAVGTSCRSQIEDGTARDAVHPICLVV